LQYHLVWEIDLEAESPEEAAAEALRVQRDIDSIVCVFTVTDKDGNSITIDAID